MNSHVVSIQSIRGGFRHSGGVGRGKKEDTFFRTLVLFFCVFFRLFAMCLGYFQLRFSYQ